MSRYVAVIFLILLIVSGIVIGSYYLLTKDRRNRENAISYKSGSRSHTGIRPASVEENIHFKQTRYNHILTKSNGEGNLTNQPDQCKPSWTEDRIHGGTDAALGDFPSIALLEYIVGDNEFSFDCGGALINHRYVLTAAHCLHRKKNLINIRLGEYDTSKNPDVDEDNNPLSGHIDVGIEKVIIHKDYSAKNMINDIGLIRLSKDVEFEDYFVQPICIPDASVSTKVGEYVIVPGWGNNAKSKHSTILQKVYVPIFDMEKCRQAFAPRQILSSQLCAGGEKGKDACTRDSGGPLITRYNKMAYVEGIVSFGDGCGKEDIPGIYTRVSDYYDWIRDKLEP